MLLHERAVINLFSQLAPLLQRRRFGRSPTVRRRAYRHQVRLHLLSAAQAP